MKSDIAIYLAKKLWIAVIPDQMYNVPPERADVCIDIIKGLAAHGVTEFLMNMRFDEQNDLRFLVDNPEVEDLLLGPPDRQNAEAWCLITGCPAERCDRMLAHLSALIGELEKLQPEALFLMTREMSGTEFVLAMTPNLSSN